MQVEHGAVLLQLVATGRTQDRAAAGCKDYVGEFDEVAEHCGLAVAKASLALELEDDGNGYAKTTLDFDVGIVKRLVQSLGE